MPIITRWGWRSLTIAGLLIAAVLPYGGFGPGSVQAWSDQSLFLRAVTSVAQGKPDPAAVNNVGPAFIAITMVLKRLAGIDYASALVLLSRMSFLLTIFLMMKYALQVTVDWRARWRAVLAAFLAPITSVWLMASDIPWSHFVAAAILAALVLLWSNSKLPSAAKAILFGFLFVCLYQTRAYEGQIAIIAGVVVLLIKMVSFIRGREKPEPKKWLMSIFRFSAGAFAAFALIGSIVGYWGLFTQYSDQQGLSVVPLHFIPKLVQLFADTCFLTFCAYVPNHSPFMNRTLSALTGPLSFQIPALLAALGTSTLLIISAPRQFLRCPSYVLFCLISSAGLIVAYVSAAPSGAEHLKYGFFRDFVPAMVLAVMGLIGLIRTVPSGPNSAAKTGFKTYFGLLGALVFVSFFGIPDIRYAHIVEFRVDTDCNAGQCQATLSAINPIGVVLPYDDRSLVKVTCPSEATMRAGSLADMRFNAGCSIGVLPFLSGMGSTPAGDVMLLSAILLEDGRHTTTYPHSRKNDTKAQ